MRRVVPSLIAGIALGAGGTYYLLGGLEHRASEDTAAGSHQSVVASPEPPASAAVLSPVGGFSDRSAVYQLAADADAHSLPALIEEGAAQPESAKRRLLLATLLARYAEFSPREAIALAEDLDLDRTIMASLYASWAAADPAAAVDAWNAVDEVRDAREIGLALFEALGANDEALATVLTSLPPNLDAARFQADLMGLWAQTAPETALRRSLTLQPRSIRGSALKKVALSWSQHDPRSALEALKWMDDAELRQAFQFWVVRDWSVLEPESAFDYVVGLRDASRRGMALAQTGLVVIARSDPLRALEFADRLPSAAARYGRQLVLDVWAQDDIRGVLAYVDSLPLSKKRQELYSEIAQTYGAQDPEAALEWARNLRPSPRFLLNKVVAGIATADPVRAVDVVLSMPEDEQGKLASTIVSGASNSADFKALATKLMELPDESARASVMGSLASQWVNADPESALTWLLANEKQAGTASFRTAARRLSEADPITAARYTNKVPAAHRPAWIQNVAAAYATMDPVAARDWMNQFQGQPAYDAGMAQMIEHSSEADPRGAARMLETIADPHHAATAAATVAQHWVRAEPQAAANWAAQLEGPVRLSAISSVAYEWARSDPEPAQRWVLDLPADSDRDIALASLIGALARKETPGRALWSAFSSETARNEILPRVVYEVAKRDPDAAQNLVDEYASDTHIRRKAEGYLVSGKRNR